MLNVLLIELTNLKSCLFNKRNLRQRKWVICEGDEEEKGRESYINDLINLTIKISFSKIH